MKDLSSRSLLQILNGDTDFDILQRICAKSTEESVSDPISKWQGAAMLKFPSLSQVRVTRSLTIPLCFFFTYHHYFFHRRYVSTVLDE